MDKNLSHTATPWYRNIRPVTKYPIVYAGDAPKHTYCFSFHVPRGVSEEQAEANMDFMLRACNSHEALVAACEYALGCATHKQTGDTLEEMAAKVRQLLADALKLAGAA